MRTTVSDVTHAVFFVKLHGSSSIVSKLASSFLAA